MEFEWRRNEKSIELFTIDANHLLEKGKVDEAIKTTNRMLGNIGWGIQKILRTTE